MQVARADYLPTVSVSATTGYLAFPAGGFLQFFSIATSPVAEVTGSLVVLTSLILAPDQAMRVAPFPAEKYGVWGEKQLYGRTYLGILRTTVVIDAFGSASGCAAVVSAIAVSPWIAGVL